MKKITLLIIALLGSMLMQAQQVSNTFQRYIDYDANTAKKVAVTSDKGYISAGRLNKGGPYYMQLLKTDFAGNTQFAKALEVNGSTQSGLYDVIQTPDKGYTCLGLYIDPNASAEIIIVKYDSCGNLKWHKEYGSSYYEMPEALLRTSTGDYLITGYTCTGTSINDRNILLMKVGANGNFKWSKSFGVNGTEEFGLGITETTDGKYAVSGRQGTDKAIIFKTDTSGNMLWGYKYIFGGGKTIKQLPDGNLMVFLGGTGSMGTSLSLMKLDANGNVLWYKDNKVNLTPSYQTGAAGGCLTPDGGMALVGYTASRVQNIDKMEFLVIKTNSAGVVEWGRTYFNGVALNQNGYSQQSTGQIECTADSGFIFGGYTYDAYLESNLYLVKTDKYGRTGCEHPVPIATTSATVTKTGFSGIIATSITAKTATVTEIQTPQELWSKNYFQCQQVYSPSDSINSTGIYGPVTPCANDTSVFSVPDLGAGYQYTWSATTGATIILTGAPNDAHIKFPNAGAHTVSLTITDYCGNVTQLSLDVNAINCPVSLNEFAGDIKMAVYPNPVSSVIGIELGAVSAATVNHCKVYNMMGEIVTDFTFTGNKTQADVSSLAKGLYLLRIENKEGTAARRFVKE